MKNWTINAIIVAFLGQSSISLAASFDCARASTLVESAICHDPELSSLDDSMAARYSEALRQSASPVQLKEGQHAWLKKRNLCKTAGCLKSAYQTRLEDLRTTPASRSTTSAALLVRPGDCVDTKIVGKHTRFEGAVPGKNGGEVFVALANQVNLYLTAIPQLSPDSNPDAYMARTKDFAIGDRVRLCLVSLPEDCPPGDDRGKIYSVTNSKNQLSFTGVDAWHRCGGA